jgi:hypothetical protein
VGLGFLAIELTPPRAFAETEAPRNEIFAGFEASDNYASAYLGGGYAFGKGLYAPGWRLRSVASYGRYRYDGSLPVGTDYMATVFDGEEYFGSALVGYQFHPDASLIEAVRRNRIGQPDHLPTRPEQFPCRAARSA